MFSEPSNKPSVFRRVLYGVVIVAGVFGGYYLGAMVSDNPTSTELPEKSASPWYQTQARPPTMITTPDRPMFPDAIEGQAEQTHRAYEEALPEAIYQPPKVTQAMPPPPRSVPIEVTALAPIKSAPKPEILVEPDEEPPWRRFAVAAPQARGRPRIVLVIDDMGVDTKRSAKIIALKAPLTLSFLTYAKHLDIQTSAAHKAGHELLLHVAMEPSSTSVDPGPNVLLTAHNKEELLRRFRWGLSRFSNYVGVNNHMGSKFTQDAEAMTVVMEEIKKRGLLFLDSLTGETSVVEGVAKRLGIPFAVRNIFLDNVNDEAAVYARLAEVERLARTHGYAIAIGHPRDATINILPRWIKEVEELGFVLSPLSSVVQGGG